jgi:plastocyanin
MFRPRSRSRAISRHSTDGRAILHARRFLLAATLAALVPGCAGHAARTPVLHRVVIRGFKFDPARLEVAAGDTVEWLNRDLVPHTATARSGGWSSDSIPPDGSWRIVPTIRGAEPYGCRLHANMKAQLDVR